MKKILLFFTALLMISAAYGGADVVVDSGIGVTQNEVSMALSSSGVLIAAYNDDPFISGPGLGVSYSTNGGVTWSSKQLNYPSAFTPPNADAFDPTAAADTLGNLYVAHISTDGNWTAGPVSGLYVHKSTNGGVTWSTPVQVSYDGAPSGSSDPNYRFNDRCQMTADTISTGSYKDNLYTAWIKDNGWNSPGPYSDIYFAYSTNQGASFTASAGTVNDNPWSGNPLTTGDMANMPVPAVAPNGDVYVSWLNYSVWTGGSGTIYLDKSTDGGVSWGTDTAVITINLPPLNLNSGTDARAKGAPVLAASTTTNNELYIVYAADPADPIDEADIYFIKSTNGGSTWSTPKKINDDATQNDQILPWIDVKPDGTIDIAWYDRRNDPFDLDWDVYFTSSSDGGSTFSPNVKISD
ncbi:glycoside hydrolase, partial [Candidatus Woesearchaeota archaeon]|nr:glycoside hydrolase [Candidatus Woesearchaeota archaeon]